MVETLSQTGLAEDHRRLAAQRPSVPYRAFQTEAHLIQEHQGRPRRYFFFDLGQGGLEPGRDRFRILFQCAFVRFLA